MNWFFFKKHHQDKNSSKDSDFLLPKDKKQLTKLINKEKKYYKNIEKLDKKILIIQRSTRTNIKSLIPLHNYLRTKVKWYYKWHLYPYNGKIHFGVLCTYILIVLLSLMSFLTIQPQPVFAAGITQTAWATQASATQPPVTMDFDCNGGNLLVLGIYVTGGTRDGAAPTYNEIAMTDSGQGEIGEQGSVYCEIWYLVNPASGPNTISIDSPNWRHLVPIASAWSGVDTADPLDTSNSDSGNWTANPSVAITTEAANELIIDAMASGHSDVPSANSHTLISSQDNGNWTSNAQYTLDDGSSGITFDWTVGSANWGMIVAAFNPAPPPVTALVSTWDTTNTSTGSSASNQVKLPLEADGTYDFTVYWGDGNDNHITTYNQAEVTHTYASAGEYEIIIDGTIYGFRFNNTGDKLKIKDISQWGNLRLGDNDGYFYGCANLNASATDTLDLTGTTTLYRAFRSASAFNQDIGSWDVSSVQNMDSMFRDASAFNGDIGSWSTLNVTDMDYMFRNASAFNQNIGSWDVSSVQYMSSMFYHADVFNGNIGNWGTKTANVTNMGNMFSGASAFNQDIGSWDVSKVKYMQHMFSGASDFNGNIGDWGNKTSIVEDMSYMFYGASAFNQNIGGWDVLSVTNMEGMFSGASAFNQDIGSWTTSSVINMSNMFNGASSFDQDIGSWDVSNVQNMSNMFKGASIFNGNIGNWSTKTANVTSMMNMFQGASSFNQNISSWNTANVINMYEMFGQASSFNQNIGSWDTSKVTNMSNMFRSASAFNGNIGNWGTKTANVTNMSRMFESASAFNQDIGSWDVSNVQNMSYMFYGTDVFNGNIGNWSTKTANVTDMSWMFGSASAFNQDIGSWDVSNVITMYRMFHSASAFNQNIGSWDTANVTTMRDMFHGASSFNQNIGNWTTTNVENMSDMFREASSFNQDISSWDVSGVVDMGLMFYQASAFDQDIGDWDVSIVADMTNMFSGATLSTANYDSLLIGWAGLLSLQNNVPFHAGNSQYSLGLPAEKRQHIITTYTWTITDNGDTGEEYNEAPSAPSSLAQYKSDCSTSISTGGWTNETEVCLKGYIDDPNTNDNVKLQIDYTTGSFDDIVDAISTDWCSDPCTASTDITGLSHGSQYKWQANGIDDDSLESTWTQFNFGNTGFGVDTTTPNILAVDAGASSSDRISLSSNTWFKYSDTGSDDKISFSWTDPNSASDDTFYYELNTDSGNTITGDEATTANPYIDEIAITEGTNYLHVRPRNNADTWGTERIFVIKYDKIAPIGATLGFGTIAPDSIIATVSGATDSGSGLDLTPYYFDRDSGGANSGWQTNTNWQDTGLVPNTQYTYKVKVKDAAGNESSYTATLSQYTLANIPSDLSLVADSKTKITAAWLANSNPSGTEYLIENITSGANSGWITALSWISTNLTCNTSYTFKVKARNINMIETASTSALTLITASCDVVPTISYLSNLSIETLKKAVVGDKVTFKLRGIKDISKYSQITWNFGDGQKASGSTVTHTYKKINRFNVTVLVKDRNSNNAIFSHIIDIVPPKPTITKIFTKGQIITIQGKAFPKSWVVLMIYSEIYQTETRANSQGFWEIKLNFAKLKLSLGKHNIIVYAKGTTSDEVVLKSEENNYHLKVASDEGELKAEIEELKRRQIIIFVVIGIIILTLGLVLFWQWLKKHKKKTKAN